MRMIKMGGRNRMRDVVIDVVDSRGRIKGFLEGRLPNRLKRNVGSMRLRLDGISPSFLHTEGATVDGGKVNHGIRSLACYENLAHIYKTSTGFSSYNVRTRIGEPK